MSTIENSISPRIKDIVALFPSNRESLIPILQQIQEEFGYLSEEAIDQAAHLMNISANEIYGVATFFSYFRFTPPGKNRIVTCQGTACHVRGSSKILDEFASQLGIKAGETTPDGQFELERVACVGCCALAPVVVVNGSVHAGLTTKDLPNIIKKCKSDK